MPSIEEGIASLKSLSDAKELEDRVLSLKMLLEEGIITQDEADQRLREFKRKRYGKWWRMHRAKGGGLEKKQSLRELMKA